MRKRERVRRWGVVASLFVVVTALNIQNFGCGGQRTSTRENPPDVRRSRSTTPTAARKAGAAADDLERRAAETELAEAVFRKLFEFRSHSLQGERANLFFIGIGDFNESISDPDASLVAALNTPGARVLPQSHSSFDVQRGVRHRRTDELGLLFYAGRGCIREDEAFVRAGYVEHGKSGMRFLLYLHYMDGGWRLVEVGRTAVS